MVIKIPSKQWNKVNALIKKLCCNCADGNCLCWRTEKNIPVFNVSAGMESTAIISKMPCVQPTRNCLSRLCSLTIKKRYQICKAGFVHRKYQLVSTDTMVCCLTGCICL